MRNRNQEHPLIDGAREMAPFDENLLTSLISDVKGCRSWSLLATKSTWNRRGFLVLAGPSNGCQLYVECAQSRLHGGREVVWIWGWAPNQFGRLVMTIPGSNEEGKILSILQWVADRSGIAAGKLFGIREVPGFEKEGASTFPWSGEEITRHHDGWYTRTKLASWAYKPSWLNGDAFRLAEGIYTAFPDGTCRLARTKEYYSWPGWYLGQSVLGETPDIILDHEGPKYRQGDLLVWEASDDARRTLESAGRRTLADVWAQPTHNFLLLDESLAEGKGSLDRHMVERTEDGWLITHPQHEALRLPVGEWIVGLLPGTSRPFSRDARLD